MVCFQIVSLIAPNRTSRLLWNFMTFWEKNAHNLAFCSVFLCFYIAQVHCFCRNNGINFNVPTFYLPQVRYILNKQIAPVGSWESFTNSILSRPFGLFGRLDFQGLIENCVADDPGHLSSIGVAELHVQSLITWSVMRRRLQCLYGNPKIFQVNGWYGERVERWQLCFKILAYILHYLLASFFSKPFRTCSLTKPI